MTNRTIDNAIAENQQAKRMAERVGRWAWRLFWVASVLNIVTLALHLVELAG